MNYNFEPLQNESENEYIIRCGHNKGILNWEELSKIINSFLGYNYTESRYRKIYSKFIKSQVEEVVDSEDSEEIQKILEKKIELEKTKVQNRDFMRVTNEYIRKGARYDSIKEVLSESIKRLYPISFPQKVQKKQRSRVGALLIGDAHFGKHIVIKGLKGEILNEYNPKIFKDYMWRVLRDVNDICLKENIDEIYTFFLGDSIEGCLRVSSLTHIKSGICDQSMEYADFVRNWLNELSKDKIINHVHVIGNHGELRLFDAKRGDLPDENIEKWIGFFLEKTLEDNPNIKFIKNYTNDMAFVNILGTDVLAVHEIGKDKIKSIRDFEATYRQNIDMICAGHSHHRQQEDTNFDQEVIVCPSLIGVDEFAVRIKKTSSPGADFLVFEEGKGKVITYNIKL